MRVTYRAAKIRGMYALVFPISAAAFVLTRGTDGKWWVLSVFPIITIVYVILVWRSRTERVGWHILAHAIIFPMSAALGAAPPPHLEELAGLLYYFLAVLVAGTVVLGAVTYFVGIAVSTLNR